MSSSSDVRVDRSPYLELGHYKCLHHIWFRVPREAIEHSMLEVSSPLEIFYGNAESLCEFLGTKRSHDQKKHINVESDVSEISYFLDNNFTLS